jgi:GH15 family glucan-1,4-alpha-glucosidase
MNEATYDPTGDYGVIGNMLSAALVSRSGSVYWCCLPRFDSLSISVAILDHTKGGYFRLAPVSEFRSEQAYVPRSNRNPGSATGLKPSVIVQVLGGVAPQL